jgi:hypothetical protein
MNDINEIINDILNPEIMYSSTSKEVSYPRLHKSPYMVTAYGIATIAHDSKFIKVNYILEDQAPDQGESDRLSTDSFDILQDRFTELTGYEFDTSDILILNDFLLISCKFGELNYRVNPITDRFWYELIPSEGDLINFDTKFEAIEAFKSLL